MVVVVRTLFLRDLRGRWVFPRLAYSTMGDAIDRNLRRLFRFMIVRPRDRAVQLAATLRDHQGFAEIGLAALALVIALIRAIATLVLALAVLYTSVARL